jgi:hypothetical protein
VADPNAQFAIDIAASMPAGETTIAQLDELTAKLMGGGKNADHFQRAIVQVSTALDAAKAATVAANTALDAGETKYRELERAALQSAKAAERAGQKSGGVIPADLAAKAHAADSAVKAYAATLAGLEREANDAAAAETRLGSTLTNVRKLNAHVNTSLAQNAERLSKLQGALGAVGGPLGRLGQITIAPIKGFTEMSQSMGAMGAAGTLATVGVAALAAALLASAAAAAAGVLAIAKWSVALSDRTHGVEFQTDRLRSNFDSLFSGLDVDPVIDAMSRLADMFDATSETGQTIKFLFETIFQPLIDQADAAAVVIEAFVIGFEIGLLKLYIALKPAIRAVKEFFGFEPDASLEDTLAFVTKAAEYVAYAFAAAAVVFGVFLAAVGAVVAILAGPTVAAFASVTAAVYVVVHAVSAVVTYLRGINLAEIGANMMRGLAEGITGATGAVYNAVRNAIKAAIGIGNKTLDAHSPSRVFAEMGMSTGEGFALGVDASAPDAQDALARMASPLAAQDAIAQKPAASPAPDGTNASVSMPNAAFNFYGVKDAQDAAAHWHEWLTRALEGDAAQLGGEAAPA